MNEDKIQRAIEFLTQSKADSAARNAVIEENFKEIEENFKRIQTGYERLQSRLVTLAELTHDLVSVSLMHSRRLDRLDGIEPR